MKPEKEMNPKKVLTTTEFVLWMIKQPTLGTDAISSHEADLGRIVRYAKIIRSPLSLEMFVVCRNRKPIEFPKKDNYTKDELQKGMLGIDILNYRQAKEKVLFEGYEWKDNKAGQLYCHNHYSSFKEGGMKHHGIISKTVEDLIIYGINLIPSDNFYKKIGLQRKK